MSNKKIILINIAAMVALLCAVPFVVLAWLDHYTQHGITVAVPDICGMHIDDASKALRNKGFDFEIVDYKYVKGVAVDCVLEQNPSAGAKVKDGRRIELTMSSDNEPMQPIPDIIDNCSLREAEARLQAAGFKLAPNVEVAGEKDWVYSLMLGSDTLRKGAKIPLGSTVTLVIGCGEEEDSEEPIVDSSWFE